MTTIEGQPGPFRNSREVAYFAFLSLFFGLFNHFHFSKHLKFGPALFKAFWMGLLFVAVFCAVVFVLWQLSKLFHLNEK